MFNDNRPPEKVKKFKVGDGAHTHINGDSYPVTVRKVSASGKSVWVSKDKMKLLESSAYKEGMIKGEFAPDDTVPESEWEKFKICTDKRGNEFWAPSAKERYYTLSHGRGYSQNPHV